ncbi:unnamed protein product, partial [Prorocentrum cordatum]
AASTLQSSCGKAACSWPGTTASASWDSRCARWSGPAPSPSCLFTATRCGCARWGLE